MIKITHKGSFRRTERYLEKLSKREYMPILREYAKLGVAALQEATPKDTGKTAESWGYKIVQKEKSIAIYFTNSNRVDGYPIAILLQYGHGTRNGGWVEGRDYINPAIQPVLDKLAKSLWREVTN